jgi:hypothetical protein
MLSFTLWVAVAVLRAAGVRVAGGSCTVVRSAADSAVGRTVTVPFAEAKE